MVPVFVSVPPAGLLVTAYPVIGNPPSDAGARNVNDPHLRVPVGTGNGCRLAGTAAQKRHENRQPAA